MIEAMAAGLPCIATDIPGNRELVEDEVTGLTIPVRSPAAIAVAIDRLLSDPPLARRLADAGYAHIDAGYDEASEAAAWCQLIDVL